MTFKDNLLQLRKERGLSQEELGFALGVTRQTVSKWGTGQTTPEMDKLIELSAFFDIGIDELVNNKMDDKRGKPIVILPHSYSYEYISKTTLFGLPLVHINIGRGVRKATGIIAIGMIARGIISLGLISLGVISFGVISVGLLALGAFGIGIVALGGLAVGVLAFGGVTFGFLTMGGVALGMYSKGGYASALKIAKGGFAKGHIAIGDIAVGDFTWQKITELTKEDYIQIKDRILLEYPEISRRILKIFVP